MPVTAQSALEAVLAPGGALSRALPGYEPRPDQLAMAEAVAQALSRRRYLVAEAGTGTGKTLAYLVPALLSGRRVVVSTATKALQEQIWYRDLPLLRDRCGLEASAAYLKGRSNYYCLARGEEFERHPTFPTREEAALWPRIREWARATETGDRAEIDLPDAYLAWRDLSATGDTCLGRECRRWEDCFVTLARARAAAADVVLVNHHLFFADLAIRSSRAGVEVLPGYEAVIFDEAHALEDVATEYFGLQVSSYRVEELARDALRAVADRPDLASLLKRTTQELQKAGERFFGAVGRGLAAELGRAAAPPGRRRGEEESLRGPLTPAILGPLERDQARLDEALEELRGELAESASPALAQIARRAADLRVELAAVTAMKEPSRVFFAEARGRGVFLRAAPIHVADELAARLYRSTDTVVFTSATLATQGDFRYFRSQVGLGDEVEVDERSYPGPFDYPAQAALVAPEGMPDPNQPAFLPAAARAIRDLTAITGGRTFVLCTSVRNMVALRDALADLPWPVLLQGERPKHRLLEAFRERPSVLFATQSFWEGVDVPGEALSLVVIDRLPFAPPGDPVVAARLRALAEEGRDGFGELQVPAAALALRQGFGRLIRSRSDRGLVAVLDPRLTTRGYGRAFLQSLPPCRLLRTAEEARRWWEDRPPGR
jgi:ATP-dependent DNA helicase DinG